MTAASQINLAWTVATDNVARDGLPRRALRRRAGCTDFVQIGTATGTSFANTGLAFGTRYSYRVRATDAAGNLGPYSDRRQRDHPGRRPRASHRAVGAGGHGAAVQRRPDQSRLDRVHRQRGVAGYRIERCRAPAARASPQVATATGTTFNDTGLAAGTSYSYRVRAADANGNMSGYSNTASAATRGR